MYKVDKVVTDQDTIDFLQKKWLRKQFQAAKTKLIMWYYGKLDFKKRQPKKEEVYSFRINKQYRAIGYFDHHTFVVATISDHHN